MDLQWTYVQQPNDSIRGLQISAELLRHPGV